MPDRQDPESNLLETKLVPKDIEQFIEMRFRPAEKRALGRIEKSARKPNEPMSPNCRVVINIPVHFGEKNLEKTLLQYLNQTALEGGKEEVGFEIVVLVNGPDGTDLKSTTAYKHAIAIQEKFPELKISVLKSTFQKSELKIGLIRKMLAGYTLKRASEAPEVDLKSLILVTNDADLQKISEEYVTGLTHAFDRNPKLGAVAGFIDYPYEDFYQDQLFLTVQRFNDILETIVRYKDGNIILRGGNSAFRVQDYMEAGGHPRSRIRSENRPLYREIEKARGKEGIQFERHVAKITTSARRQIVAVAENVPIAERYENFGKPGDLAELYQAPVETLVIPESTHKITSPEFTGKLEAELQAVYKKFLNLSPSMNSEQVQKLFHRAAFFAGFKLSFEGETLHVTDISTLRSQVIKKYNHF